MKYSLKDIVTTKNGNLIALIISGALFVYVLLVFLGTVSIDFILEYVPNKEMDLDSMKLPLLFTAGLILLIAAIIYISDIVTQSRISKSLTEYTEDDVLDQMNNHLVYEFKYHNEPRFFVTEKYIVSKNGFVCSTQDISWTYQQKSKENNLFIIRLRDNTELNAGGFIAMGGKVDECREAMSSVVSGLLIGDTKENREAHKERVKLSREPE